MAVLLVEGPDDFHVVRNLLRQRATYIEDENIRPLGGYDVILEALPTYLKSSETAIGVIIDTDWDVAARWQAVSDRARKAGYSVPGNPEVAGIIVEADGQPRLGLWLMPNNFMPGAVEEFVEMIISPTDQLWTYARETVESIPESNRRFKPQAKTKAQIHTWLAWQEQPGAQMGAAITRQYFKGSSADVDNFVDWVRRLIQL